jgi:hypothetical protein
VALNLYFSIMDSLMTTYVDILPKMEERGGRSSLGWLLPICALC